MKLSKFIRLSLLLTILTLFLTACGGDTTDSNKDAVRARLNSGEGYELNLNYSESDFHPAPIGDISWEPLASSGAYISTGFRTNFEKAFNTNNVTVVEDDVTVDSKQGCLFTILSDGEEITSGNSTMRDAFRNEVFIKYWSSIDTESRLSDTISRVYKDVDAKGTLVRKAALNAFYNLSNLSDSYQNYEPSSILSRNQFYSMIYRSSNPVTDIDISSTDLYRYIGFDSSDYYSTLASQIVDFGYLSLSDNSLNQFNINLPITKFEAYYLLSTYFFPDFIEKVSIDESSTAFGIRNAGNSILELGFNSKWDYLCFLSNDQSIGMDESILKVLATAERLGLSKSVGGDLFNSLTKDNAIQLLINVFTTENSSNIHGYLTKEEYAKIIVPEYEYEDLVEIADEIDFSRPLMLSEEKVQFNPDQDTFVDADTVFEVLFPVIDYMVEHPEFKVLLIGTTAGDDNSDYSKDLSQRRAEAVRSLMVEYGVDPTQITSLGLGGSDPWHIYGVGTNSEEAAKNRKVVIIDIESVDAKHILNNVPFQVK